MWKTKFVFDYYFGITLTFGNTAFHKCFEITSQKSKKFNLN